METRTSSKQVTFVNPFYLAGMGHNLPAGTYTVTEVEQQLDAISILAWRHVSAVIEVRREGAVEHVAIDMEDLRNALSRDGDQSGALVVSTADRPRSRLRGMLRLPGALYDNPKH